MPNTITTYNIFIDNTKAKATEVNTNFSNHRGTVVPIETDTSTASDVSHDLGSSEHRWKRAYIEAGHGFSGMITYQHSYNGLFSIPQGYMRCDGLTITEAVYDAQHNAGDWAIFVASTSAENLVTPNLIGKYAVGVTATTQGGTAAVTAVGNGSNQVNIAHVHGGGTHNHQWYDGTSAASNDKSWDADGSAKHIIGNGSSKNAGIMGISGTTNTTAIFSSWTKDSSATTDTAASSTQSIQPESIEFIPLIRVI